jgi:prolyl-tRNA synthetase
VTGRSLKDGKVEVVERATKKSQDIAIDEVMPTLKQWIDTALKA